MPLELHCIRHGVTKELLAGRFQGDSDAELADDEIERIKAVRFDASTCEAIYCSPLGRCVHTAELLGISDTILDGRIRKRGLGIFQGLTKDECREKFPADFDAFERLDADSKMPGGESRSEQLARILSWLEDISPLSRVLAITHGGVFDFLYRLATQSPLHGGKLFSGDNLTLSVVDVNWPELRLIDYNKPLETSAG